MNLIILHGGGLVSKNNKLSQIKKGFDPMDIVELNGKGLTWGQVKTDLLSSLLFSPKRLVILEDFPQIKLEELTPDENLTLVLNFNKSLISTSVILKEAKKFNAQVIEFSEEQETSIFPFLDLLCEKNPRAQVELGKYLDEWGNQYVLTMMAYALRRFVGSPKKLPPFVLRKMENQRKNLPLERIKMLYREIIETDFKIKRGLIEPDMGLFLLTEKFLN